MNMERENGFTLVELLISIVIVTTLLAMGVPSIKDFMKNNRLSAQSNALVTGLQVARSEAVKRGADTVICASSNQTCLHRQRGLGQGLDCFFRPELERHP